MVHVCECCWPLITPSKAWRVEAKVADPEHLGALVGKPLRIEKGEGYETRIEFTRTDGVPDEQTVAAWQDAIGAAFGYREDDYATDMAFSAARLWTIDEAYELGAWVDKFLGEALTGLNITRLSGIHNEDFMEPEIWWIAPSDLTNPSPVQAGATVYRWYFARASASA